MSDDSRLLLLRHEQFLIETRESRERHERIIDLEEIRHAEAMRPSSLYRPRLSIDGDMWCALYGENLQDGVAGFGKSPEEAYAAFDVTWRERLPGGAP